MDNKGKPQAQQILSVMRILAWVAFVAYMIEGGAILTSYGMSLVNPEGAKNLYNGLDLYDLSKYNFWHYTLTVSFMIGLSILKSLISFQVIKTLSKFNLKNPFTAEVARRLEKISYISFGTWVVAMLGNAHRAWLLELTGKLQGNWVSGEFIFMVGLVFVISQVFKRGVEIQSENELTV